MKSKIENENSSNAAEILLVKPKLRCFDDSEWKFSNSTANELLSRTRCARKVKAFVCKQTENQSPVI